MRDNTSTARLEDTPTPEQDSSTAPEPDFEFQEGRELILTCAPVGQLLAITEPDGPGPAVLYIEDQGEDMMVLRVAELPSPRLYIQHQGGALLAMGSQPQRAYSVPADLVETVAAVTGAQVHTSLEPAEDHAEQRALREALPQVLQVLPEGPDRLVLELSTGARVVWEADEEASLIPSEMYGHRYGLSVLSFWRAPGTPAYAVPDALLPELLRHIPGADQQAD